MKKLVIILSSVCFVVYNGFSQKKIFSIGAGPSINFVISNANHNFYYKNGVGGTVQLNYGVTKLGTVTVTGSYLSIGAKNPPVTNTSITQLKAGYKTGFLNSGFFAAADAGLILNKRAGGNSYVFSASAGYSFKISSSSYIDLFPAYSIVTGSNSNMWLTANALFRFKLPKKK